MYMMKKHTRPLLQLKNEVLMLDPKDCPDMIYFIPCPKSPHGAMWIQQVNTL